MSASAGTLPLAVASPGTLLLASVRTTIAEYLSTVIYVYILLIVLYIIVQLILGVGGYRPAYSRTTDAILQFLRDVSEPYLRIFRRLLPSVGGFDFSPMVAILLLVVANKVIVGDLIYG